jgi:alkyl-hydroperoxide reductase/thiol specific antioxidant family protein
LRGRRGDIEASGAALAIVGNGSVAHARRFQERHVPGIAVYTDPELATYTALKLRRSVVATLGASSALAFARATVRGHRQTSIEGDPWQQGGLIVLAPGAELLHVQRFHDAGGRPDVDAALAALGASSQGARVRPRPRPT